MKRVRIALVASAIIGILVYLAIQQYLAIVDLFGGFPVNLIAFQLQTMNALLSNPLISSIFWIGLLLGEFSAGLIALKIFTIWSSRDATDEVQDNSSEIQKLFDAFLTY